LGQRVEVDGYSLQIPKGFEIQQPTVKTYTKKQVWVGPERPEMGRPVLSVSRFTLPPERLKEINQMTLKAVAKPLMEAHKRVMTNWKEEDIEYGMVNGRDFARIRWAGISNQTQQGIRGFYYLTLDVNGFVYLVGQDNAPTSTKTLPMIETAALTIQIK
jgi:hypothetical protein